MDRPTAMERVIELRQGIDSLDDRIVELLNARAGVVVELAALKQQTNEPVYAPHRERAVLARIRTLNSGPLTHTCIEAIYRELMSGSFALTRTLRIGYLGPAGSFSEAAATQHFGSSVGYVPLTSIAAVFDEVSRGRIDYGMVPFENSTHGAIPDTLDAFTESSAKICAEVKVRIHHNVMAKKPWVDIKRIYSKSEVFRQCRDWLAATAKGRELIAAASSSKAAELAASDETSAAIASTAAGAVFGLDVLFENIEDYKDNVTRFVIIGREPSRRCGVDKTAIMFITADKPGALAEVLDVFKEGGINLTDIEKRPSRNVNWQYCFFIDAHGHLEDEPMQRALEKARSHCLQLTVLGSFPRAQEVF
ncbi:MAG: prephenate dehydratase [Polyangiales bacterium]